MESVSSSRFPIIRTVTGFVTGNIWIVFLLKQESGCSDPGIIEP